MNASLQLRPRPGMTSAPTLTVSGGQLTLQAPGEKPVVLGLTRERVLTLARYRTTMSTSDRRYVSRVGWRLLDSNGACVAWLANSDRPAYDDADVAEFAGQAGFALTDLGDVSFADLQAGRGLPLGPGTSRAGSVVAPAFQWVLTGTVAGSGALVFGPFVGRSPGLILLGSIVTFIGILAGLFLGRLLGLAQHVWREQRYRRRHPSGALRSAERTPGLVLTADADRLYVHDYAHTWAGPRGTATLAPYDVTGREHPRGLFVTWAGTSERVDIPVPFLPGELSAFAARHHLVLRPAYGAQLPPRLEADELAQVHPVGRLGRIAWLGPLLWLVAVAAASAAVLGFTGVIAVPVGACVSLAGLALLIVSGYGIVATQCNDSLVHPARI